MATIRVTLNGRLGQISGRSLAVAVRRSLEVLEDLDRRLSEQRAGTLEWVVSGLGEGSLYVDLQTRVRRGRTDHSRRIHRTFTGGLAQIQGQEGTPAYFSNDNVVAVKDIVGQIGRGGITSVGYEEEPGLTEEPSNAIELTQQAEEELQKLTGLAYRALGSIEGLIEVVSVRRHARHFNITHWRTHRSVRCNLPEALEDSVFEAIQQRRRVLVSGLIAYNGKNEPMRIFSDKPLRILAYPPHDLPSPEELAGCETEMTDPLDTEEFVRSLRDG